MIFVQQVKKRFLSINFYKLFFLTIEILQMTPTLNVPSFLAKAKAHINDHLLKSIGSLKGKVLTALLWK